MKYRILTEKDLELLLKGTQSTDRGRDMSESSSNNISFL